MVSESYYAVNFNNINKLNIKNTLIVTNWDIELNNLILIYLKPIFFMFLCHFRFLL